MLLWVIALGGALGAVARYSVSGWVQGLTSTTFPLGTLVVNVVGSFLLGFALYLLESTAPTTEVRSFVTIGFLYWWIAELAGIHFDAVTLIELILGLPFFGMAMVVFPMLAWVLLLMVVVSSYRLAGSGWIPGTVMVFGSGVALGKLGEIMARVAYALPGWRIFRHALGAVVERFGPIDPDVSMEMSQVIYQGLPIEPLLIMLAVTALMIFLAGRIWQEVEA